MFFSDVYPSLLEEHNNVCVSVDGFLLLISSFVVEVVLTFFYLLLTLLQLTFAEVSKIVSAKWAELGSEGKQVS